MHNSIYKTFNAVDYIENWTGPGVWTDAAMHYIQSAYNITWERFIGIRANVVLGQQTFVAPPQIDDQVDGKEEQKEYKKADLVITTVTGFSPGHLSFPGSMDPDHPLAYVHHHFAGSWKGSDS